MTRYSGLIFAALLAAAAAPAAAQQTAAVSLVPADPPRWDAAGYFGWRGGNKSGLAPEWDEWYDAASFGGSLGVHWTPHLRIELDLSTTADGEVFVQEQIFVPGDPLPIFRYGEHRFRTTTFSGGVLYQFGENAWFHPFLGAGLEAVRERSVFDVEERLPCSRQPCTPLPVPDGPSVSYRAMPFASAGFKWYLTERAFLRTDVRSAFSTERGVDHVTWRIGIGADF